MNERNVVGSFVTSFFIAIIEVQLSMYKFGVSYNTSILTATLKSYQTFILIKKSSIIHQGSSISIPYSEMEEKSRQTLLIPMRVGCNYSFL